MVMEIMQLANTACYGSALYLCAAAYCSCAYLHYYYTTTWIFQTIMWNRTSKYWC